jgi:hypothetical protein
MGLADFVAWLGQKRLLSVSLSWKFGGPDKKKPTEVEWIGQRKEKKDERPDDRHDARPR